MSDPKFGDNESSARSSGYDWFTRLIIEIVRRYAKTASADYLRKKYAGLPKDLIAQKYIGQQALIAALAGGLSALVVSGAFVASVSEIVSAVGVPALLISVPVGIGAFLAEMSYTIRLQIKTAFDLCNLYSLPVNPDDPEDLIEIFAMGMGIKSGEATGNVLQKIAPSIAMQQARGLMRAGLVRRTIQDWAAKNLSREFARRYLAEGFLLKVVVPGFSVALGAGWNYYFTKGLGHVVSMRVRGRGMSVERINEIQISNVPAPELVLATALNIMMSDSRMSENEVVAYKELCATLRKIHPHFVPENLGGQWAEKNEWLAKVASVEDEDTRKTVFAVAETMTIIDGQVGREEIKLLKYLSKLLGIQFDEMRLRTRAKPFYVIPPGRGCIVVLLIFAAGLVISACACSASVFLFARQFLQK